MLYIVFLIRCSPFILRVSFHSQFTHFINFHLSISVIHLMFAFTLPRLTSYQLPLTFAFHLKIINVAWLAILQVIVWSWSSGFRIRIKHLKVIVQASSFTLQLQLSFVLLHLFYPFVPGFVSGFQVEQIISSNLFALIIHSLIAFTFLALSFFLYPQVFTFLTQTFLTVLSIILLVVTCSWFFSFHILIRHQLVSVRV